MSTLFAQRLKELRKEKKLTQAVLANVLEYGYTAISNYESGKNEPSYSDLVALADYFCVTTDYLLGRTDMRVFTNIETEISYRIDNMIKEYEKISLADVIRAINSNPY
ncbi:helix-turn-helix domain-containing protein [Anaerotignum faecicola]|nr:helix-turn-helix domain-containing protein [Anaerotignum faecicola]